MSTVFILNINEACAKKVKASVNKRKAKAYIPPKFKVYGMEGPHPVTRVFKTEKAALKFADTITHPFIYKL